MPLSSPVCAQVTRNAVRHFSLTSPIPWPFVLWAKVLSDFRRHFHPVPGRATSKGRWGNYIASMIIRHYYMANPVLGKSLCSDWFSLGQDFAVRTVSIETVESVYFCFGARPANSKFATKTAKKKVWKLSFFTLKLPAEAKKIEIFPKFPRWMRRTNIF
mgnify:CR=1 FL=1